MVNEKKKNTLSKKIAEKNYEPNDYYEKNQLSFGLATTHEQVSDTLTEGTIDGKIDDVDKKNLPLRK